MKIDVIFTGGTIGSAMQSGYISPTDSAKYNLIANYKNKFGNDVEFITHNPYTILSENLSAQTLNKLIAVVTELINTNCDGILVVHGTDTLQYSAAAVECCFGNNIKPIIFVSANYPLENSASNGNINFEAAVEFIKQSKGGGVYVSYSNDLKSVDIHSATRLLRHAEFDHKLFSLNGVYATYQNKSFTLNSKYIFEDVVPSDVKVFPKSAGILNITVSPFEEYNYSLNDVKAVVFTPYHSGTLNTESEKLKHFAKKAAEKSVPMYVTGVVKGAEYQSVKAYTDLKIVPVYNTTSIALMVKLWLLGKV